MPKSISDFIFLIFTIIDKHVFSFQCLIFFIKSHLEGGERVMTMHIYQVGTLLRREGYAYMLNKSNKG